MSSIFGRGACRAQDLVNNRSKKFDLAGRSQDFLVVLESIARCLDGHYIASHCIHGATFKDIHRCPWACGHLVTVLLIQPAWIGCTLFQPSTLAPTQLVLPLTLLRHSSARLRNVQGHHGHRCGSSTTYGTARRNGRIGLT